MLPHPSLALTPALHSPGRTGPQLIVVISVPSHKQSQMLQSLNILLALGFPLSSKEHFYEKWW